MNKRQSFHDSQYNLFVGAFSNSGCQNTKKSVVIRIKCRAQIKIAQLFSLVISKVAFLIQICNCTFLITENWSEEMIGRNKSLHNGQILSFMTS